jgi:hypothetical protein
MNEKDWLYGIFNYFLWKVRLSVVLKEKKIYNYVNSVVAPPAVDPIALDLHEVKESKAHRIILDGVKDHLIPHLVEKRLPRRCGMHLKTCLRRRTRTRRWP